MKIKLFLLFLISVMTCLVAEKKAETPSAKEVAQLVKGLEELESTSQRFSEKGLLIEEFKKEGVEKAVCVQYTYDEKGLKIEERFLFQRKQLEVIKLYGEDDFKVLVNNKEVDGSLFK